MLLYLLKNLLCYFYWVIASYILCILELLKKKNELLKKNHVFLLVRISSIIQFFLVFLEIFANKKQH